MKLTPHFDLSEFTVSQTAARLKIDNTPTESALAALKVTAQWLEGVRTLLGVPIIITSGYRSPKLNKAVRGSASSQHMTGEAVDFVAPTFGSPRHVIDRIIDAGMEFDQLILEFPSSPGGGWVHASYRPHMRRHQALVIDGAGYQPLRA